MKKILAVLIVVLLAAGCAAPRRNVQYVPDNRGYVSGPSYVVPAQSSAVYPTQQDQNKKILMQGLTGAAVGAIAAEASDGKAATGALVGAGTNVIGQALIETISAPRAQQPAYVNQGYVQQSPYRERKILRKYDSQGNIVSEEEIG